MDAKKLGELGNRWKRVAEISLKLPRHYVTDEKVKEGVLPELRLTAITHIKYEALLQDFAEWYKEYHTEDTTCLWYNGYLAEAGLFRELVELGYLGQSEAPYCPIEVSETLRTKGFPSESINTYAKKYDIEAVGEFEKTPLRDAEVAYYVCAHLYYGESSGVSIDRSLGGKSWYKAVHMKEDMTSKSDL